MATVTGFTADRMQQIEDNVITAADIVDGDLIFARYDGSTLNAGPIAGSILNPAGVWDIGTAYNKSDLVFHTGATWLATDAVTAGLEPGVDPIWQEFAVSSFEDLTVGDHNIDGLITFDNQSPVIPAASADDRAANLGDVKTEIAQEPLLLDAAEDEITYVDESGDMRTVLTDNLVRQVANAGAGVYFPHTNTMAESVGLISGLFGANVISNYDKFRIDLSGTMKNNSGVDIDFTFRIKSDSTSVPDLTIFEHVVTLPFNSPAGDIARPFSLSAQFTTSSVFATDNIIAFGTSRLTIGDRIDDAGEVFFDQLKANATTSAALLRSVGTTFLVTVQMSIAHANASITATFGSIERLPYVAP